MYIIQRSLIFMRGFLLSYAPTRVKKFFWDKEFSGTKWDFIDNTAGDCVYSYLEKYSRQGDILDLGCGPGNTANELAEGSYRTYIGVDISDAALAKAIERTNKNGRGRKNSFVQSDFLGYAPPQNFDVILFRESLYHVPFGEVKPILDKFSKSLKADGVFVVRLYAGNATPGKIKWRIKRKLDLIRQGFNVLEFQQFDTPAYPTVIVFRPKKQSV
jgi:SAM-dependent methyltransferase